MKTFFLTLSLFVALGAGAAQAQTQTTGKTAVVRLFEANGARRAFLSYGDGRTEMIELPGVVGKKDQKDNTEQVQRLMDRLYAEGYHVVTSFSGAGSETTVSTLLFRKD